MIKKLVIGGAAAGLLATLLFGRDAFSYVSTSVGWVKGSVKNSVPIEFEIERARNMIQELGPDIRNNMHAIAEEEVQVERLRERIGGLEGKLKREQQAIFRLRDDLSSARGVYVYDGRSYNRDQVKTDLSNRFASYQTQDETLKSLRQMYDARQQSLAAAQMKLEGMLAAKRQLEVDVENLEAQLKLVEAAQTTSNYNFDDSRLSRVKELVDNLEVRLEVARKVVDADDHFTGRINVEPTVSDDIVDQVTNYFDSDEQAENVATLEPSLN